MKNISLFFVIIVFSMKLQAQGKTPDPSPQPGPSPQTLGIIDGVVEKQDVITQTKMEYAHVREADYTWAKRVFSRIDSRELMNHCIFFPHDFFTDEDAFTPWSPPDLLRDIDKPTWYKNDKNWSLWTVILQNIMLGKLTVYNPAQDRSMLMGAIGTDNLYLEDGYSFKYPIKQTDPNKKKDYFSDSKYRSNVNLVLSGGAKNSRNFEIFEYRYKDIFGDTTTDGAQWYWKGSAGETFDQWTTRLFSVGDIVNNIKPEAFTDLGTDNVPKLQQKLLDPIYKAKILDSWTEADPDGELKLPPLRRYISSSCITAYNIKEDWYFDKNRSKLEQRIIAIAPVARYDADTNLNKEGFLNRDNLIFVNKDGKLVDAMNAAINMKTAKIVEKEIFWLYFDELRDILVKYYVYNENSDAQQDSFDDLFIQRRFSATAYKTSDKFDREIEDYKFGVDRLYEAERIKEEIRKWEQDVWNY